MREVLPSRDKLKALTPPEVSKNFWPNFYDGTAVSKYIMPIRPEYHNRLFVECGGRQTSLAEHAGQFIIEGNTIKKAYLCHSKLKKISKGDILLFYRSQDRQELTSIGVVETVHLGLRDKDQITKLVCKRTVYSLSEIEERAKKPTMVILFTWHFNLKNPLNLGELKKLRVLAAAPQSITEISHGQYLEVKQSGGMDERFAVD